MTAEFYCGLKIEKSFNELKEDNSSQILGNIKNYKNERKIIMSEEEKIRRAERIADMRNNRIPASNINNREKRRMTFLEKFTIQVLTSICVFSICYFLTQNHSYAIDLIKPVISNDTDFRKVYENINDTFKNINRNSEQEIEKITNAEEENQLKEEEQKEDEKKEEEVKKNQVKEEQGDKEQDGVGGGEDNTQVSEAYDDISYIKKTVSFIKPVEGIITSPYGTRKPTSIISANHAGIDIGADIGTEIKAAMEGEVEIASSEGDYGNHLIVINGEIKTVYAHCNRLFVTQGEHITQGQKIAEVGTTGRSTGPHLHFEIRRNNTTVDPQQILENW